MSTPGRMKGRVLDRALLDHLLAGRDIYYAKGAPFTEPGPKQMEARIQSYCLKAPYYNIARKLAEWLDVPVDTLFPLKAEIDARKAP